MDKIYRSVIEIACSVIKNFTMYAQCSLRQFCPHKHALLSLHCLIWLDSNSAYCGRCPARLPASLNTYVFMHCQYVPKARESWGLGLKLLQDTHALSCSIDMHSQLQRKSQKISVKNRHRSRFEGCLSRQTGICWRLDSLDAAPYFPSV